MKSKYILKLKKKSLSDIEEAMDKKIGRRTNFREAYEGGRYGNDEQAKTKMLMLLDELKDTDNSKAGQLINHIKAMPSF